LISGGAVQGQMLSSTNGGWMNSPTSFARQWEDCNAVGGKCISIAGATASTLVLAASDVGHSVRVVVMATNAGGSASATSAKTAAVASSVPQLGKSVRAAVVSGRILIEPRGSHRFVALSGEVTIAVGSVVDATHGVVTLTSAKNGKGVLQSADFWDGLFRVTQLSRSGGLTNLTLAGSLSGCPGVRVASVARRRPRRHLWGSGSGSYRTTGQYSSGTVRGTKWLVEDRCGETITRVVRGVVTVSDFVLHRTFLVRAGHSYVARARKRA
jgi:hypothetical protein